MLNALHPCMFHFVFTEPEVLFYRNSSVDLGSITVDWVYNEVYWVERQDGYRVC